MKKVFNILFMIILLMSLIIPITSFAAGKAKENDSTKIIIQTEDSVSDLIKFIESNGGKVKRQFKNVPAVAATVPVESQETIASYPGVSCVEKDVLISLPDFHEDSDHPLVYAATECKECDNIKSLDVSTLDLDALPEGYANFLYTGAINVWGETNYGEGSIVAVVDTGTAPNVCLQHAVIGAPGYPYGYNALGYGPHAMSEDNHWHGTHVAGVIASSCSLNFSEDPEDPLYLSVSRYLPWLIDFVPIVGQAPGAQIYPVKVFDIDGSGSPTSVILEGLDHILTLKKEGMLDIDIVNMSLGGPTVYDGRDTFDKFIKELEKAHMSVITSAGNEGPTPNSVGSPATSLSSISVGALDYPASSRVLYEYLGLIYMGMDGQGMIMRPHDEISVTLFSSRGPLSDGRSGPDLAALGMWNFHAGPLNELRWASGTSFASPTVAGGVALLNAWWENVKGKETDPGKFRSAILSGANETIVGAHWQSENDQGYGAFDALASLEILKDKKVKKPKNPKKGNQLEPNILPPKPKKNKVDSYEGDEELGPSEKTSLVFTINEYTSKVTIEISEIDTPYNPNAFWKNALWISVQSAKRTAVTPPISGLLWYPFWYGDTITIVIEDGPWTVNGGPCAYQPMECGLMKVSVAGDWSNESPVTCNVSITREGYREPLRHPYAKGKIKMDKTEWIPVDIPPDTNKVTFDLEWERDWSKFPTSDIDMIIYPPTSWFILDGATLNSPERVVCLLPEEGTWWVKVQSYELYKSDSFKLYVTME